MKALSEASAPPGSQIYFAHAKRKRAGARVHAALRRCGAVVVVVGGGLQSKAPHASARFPVFPPSSFVFLLFVFLSDLTWINCGSARFTLGCNCGENKERLRCERADSTLECWIARRCGSTAFCRGAVFTRVRHGGEPPVPAGDGMCWLGSGFLDSGGPLSISGLHVWQLDHINLIFKLQHAVPTTACKLFLGWGGGGGEHVLHARSMQRQACMLGECLAQRRCQQQLAALPVSGAFVRGGAEAT